MRKRRNLVQTETSKSKKSRKTVVHNKNKVEEICSTSGLNKDNTFNKPSQNNIEIEKENVIEDINKDILDADLLINKGSQILHPEFNINVNKKGSQILQTEFNVDVKLGSETVTENQNIIKQFRSDDSKQCYSDGNTLCPEILSNKHSANVKILSPKGLIALTNNVYVEDQTKNTDLNVRSDKNEEKNYDTIAYRCVNSIKKCSQTLLDLPKVKSNLETDFVGDKCSNRLKEDTSSMNKENYSQEQSMKSKASNINHNAVIDYVIIDETKELVSQTNKYIDNMLMNDDNSDKKDNGKLLNDTAAVNIQNIHYEQELKSITSNSCSVSNSIVAKG